MVKCIVRNVSFSFKNMLLIVEIQTSAPDRNTTGGTSDSTVLIVDIQSRRYSDTSSNWTGMALACESMSCISSHLQWAQSGVSIL